MKASNLLFFSSQLSSRLPHQLRFVSFESFINWNDLLKCFKWISLKNPKILSLRFMLKALNKKRVKVNTNKCSHNMFKHKLVCKHICLKILHYSKLKFPSLYPSTDCCCVVKVEVIKLKLSVKILKWLHVKLHQQKETFRATKAFNSEENWTSGKTFDLKNFSNYFPKWKIDEKHIINFSILFCMNIFFPPTFRALISVNSLPTRNNLLCLLSPFSPLPHPGCTILLHFTPRVQVQKLQFTTIKTSTN